MDLSKKINTFDKDLERGKEGELKVLLYFKSKGYIVQRNESKIYEEMKGYDLAVTGKTESLIEVKDDFLFDKTGNVALEYNCASYTKSDFFVYVLGKLGLWYLPTEDLRKLLSSQHKGFDCLGGSEGRERLKIVSFYTFKKYAKELK